MAREYWNDQGLFGIKIRIAIRITQFCAAVISIGLFASSFSNSPSRTTHIYAFFTIVSSILVNLFHCLATVVHGAWLILDFYIAILWAALSGTIGMDVLRGTGHEKLTGRKIDMFTAAMSFGLISMCFWLLSFAHGCAWCIMSRKPSKHLEAPEVEAEGLKNPDMEEC